MVLLEMLLLLQTLHNPYLFRVVTQRYGKGIVQYGNNNATLVFPNSKTDGGQYDNVCDAEGKIYLEVDLQVPVCITCGGSLDGYTGSTFLHLPWLLQRIHSYL
jgi:hypothetical protein